MDSGHCLATLTDKRRSDGRQLVASIVGDHEVVARIWKVETDIGLAYSTTFERRYKDESGCWVGASDFSERELPELIQVAALARERLLTEISVATKNKRPGKSGLEAHQ
jgi:hypothetical protein